MRAKRSIKIRAREEGKRTTVREAEKLVNKSGNSNDRITEN